MRETPWGPLPVSDAHVHFFSHQFFRSIAAQKEIDLAALGLLLEWQMPPEDARILADSWKNALDANGIDRAVLIASVPGDHESVITAVRRFPQNFYGYMMVDPTAPDAPTQVETALTTGHLHGLCFFPAMHRYSIHDERVVQILDLASRGPRPIIFVHCGVLSVGIRKKLGLPSRFDMRFSNPIDLHPVALRYRELKFIVPHFGAGYFREALMTGDLCPNVYLDTSSSNSWMRYQEAQMDLRTVFRRALEVFGPQRLLFGTDSSFFPRGWNSQIYEAQVKALYEIGVEASEARMLLHDNLQQLLS